VSPSRQFSPSTSDRSSALIARAELFLLSSRLDPLPIAAIDAPGFCLPPCSLLRSDQHRRQLGLQLQSRAQEWFDIPGYCQELVREAQDCAIEIDRQLADSRTILEQRLIDPDFQDPKPTFSGDQRSGQHGCRLGADQRKSVLAMARTDEWLSFRVASSDISPHWPRQQHGLKVPDAILLATARCGDLTLATRNSRISPWSWGVLHPYQL
jgi:hypothetical protein